jgi:hypothetical protein
MIRMIPIEPIFKLILKDQNFKTFPMINPKIESMITFVIKLNFMATTPAVKTIAIKTDKKGFLDLGFSSN